MNIEIDNETLEDVYELYTSDIFANFLLSNTTDFAAAAFILDAIEKRYKEIKEEINGEI